MWAPGDSWDNSPISLLSRRVHRSFRNRRSDDDEVNVDHCGDGGDLEEEVSEVHACWWETASFLQ